MDDRARAVAQRHTSPMALGHTDAQRNLISNIHGRGILHEEAARRILALAEKMRMVQLSGIPVKEELAKAT